MQDSEIYTKTEAGWDEIRARTLKLPMAMRAILLMVDGQRTVSDLRGIIAGSKAPPDALDMLLALGLIAGTSEPAPAAMSAARMPQGAAPYAPPQSPVYSPANSPPDSPLSPPPATLHTPATAPRANPVAAGVSPAAAPPTTAAPAPIPDSHGELGDPRTRFDRLYTAMNEIVRDFLPAHRRYFIQLKIERCNTVEELQEVLHDLRTALTKARGDAFATDVIARLRSAAA